MPFVLEHFRVAGLHGRRDVDVAFKDNRLVLVGENGTGKSTFAKLVFYTLTRQWAKLGAYDFDRLDMSISGREFVVLPAQMKAYLEHRSRLHHLVPKHWKYRHFDVSEEVQEELLLTLSDDIRPELARQFLLKLSGEDTPDAAAFASVTEDLEARVDSQVLFLPTYRRIEQDLKAIFPGLESDVAKYRDRQASRGSKRYIEFVEFGMEDVERMIARTMDQVKEFARTGLNNLMGAYLRDVIRGLPTVDFDAVRDIDTDTLTSMIERIDETTLPKTDKNALLHRVADMKTRTGVSVPAHDSVVAHFLLKVYALYREQQHRERSVREFIRVCNGYLTGKRLVYDDRTFNIYIESEDPVDSHDPTGGLPKLALKMLSSGEKQIVSLFAHIYLSETEGFFIVIDEPELSLSVEWQRTFLPDILQTAKCTGLIAATHSPFIWQNQLDLYVHSLSEFMAPAHVSR